MENWILKEIGSLLCLSLEVSPAVFFRIAEIAPTAATIEFHGNSFCTALPPMILNRMNFQHEST